MSNLQFQSFDLGDSNSPFTSANSNQEFRSNTNDTSNLVADKGAETETAGSKHHFLSFSFYQQYFDVDTEQVYKRILHSVVPKKDGNFIRDHVQPVPDLYGPFWIAVTLVFAAAISANFAHYIESLGEDLYTNDFTLVTGISTLISVYVLGVPLALYLLLWHRQAPIQYSYPELLSLYGYSLSSWVVVSALWTVLHFSALRWTFLIAAVIFSGFVVSQTVWEAIRSDSNRMVSFAVVGGVMFTHFACALFIKEIYLDTVLPATHVEEVPALPPTAAALIASKAPVPELPKAAALVNGTEPLEKQPKEPKKPEVEANKTAAAKDEQKPKNEQKDGKQQPKVDEKDGDPKNQTEDGEQKAPVEPQLVVQPKNETN